MSNAFSPLEILLMGSLTSVVGGITLLAYYFHSYMHKTNQERAEEIASSVKVTTELKGVIDHNNYLVENLPGRIEEKFKATLMDEKIQMALKQIQK